MSLGLRRKPVQKGPQGNRLHECWQSVESPGNQQSIERSGAKTRANVGLQRRPGNRLQGGLRREVWLRAAVDVTGRRDGHQF